MLLNRTGVPSGVSGPRASRRPRRRHGEPSFPDAALVLESLEPAVVGRGLDGVIRTWNQGAERLYGYTAQEIVGQGFDALVPNVRRRREAELTAASLKAGLSDRCETRRRHKDGHEIEIDMRISRVRDRAGAVVGVSTIEDEVSTIEDDAVGSPRSPAAGPDRFLRGAFRNAPIGMALVSIEPHSSGSIFRANGMLAALTGHPLETLEVTNVESLLHPDDVFDDRAAVARLISGEIDRSHLEQRLIHAERHAVWITVDVALARDGDGSPVYAIRQMQDIEERKRYEGELGYLLEHDPLTGLLNRRGFLRELTHALAYARRYGGGGAVLFLDLDDLKSVNDAQGHEVGDEMLSEVGRVVAARLRETDSFARLGGDEFAVLLPHTTSVEAQALAASLLETVREGCSVALDGGRKVSISIGVGDFRDPGEDQTAEDILVNADDAMYLAKESGKNRVAVASRATRERSKSRVTWAERVRRVLRDDQFELYCQPIVHLASEQITQWEILLRMPGEGDELILPAQFLYTAERSGMILEIDRWVVGQALGLLSAHAEAGRALRLEVNISGKSVGDALLLELIQDGLEPGRLNPGDLVLEVTESAAISNMDRAREFATTLRSLGCGFALDDFGAGFGSFYYLKHIPFDYVKIDGEFIRNLPSSSTDRLILDSIVQMSKGLEKATIAEFVGDDETVEILRELGVDYGQGFHLGRPRPVSEVLAL
jgi:diguanylate cyclase (GGDEF)-like protein/PAS domain S-box-containing protein